MGLLDGLTTDENIKVETDSLGGFQVLDSNVYDFKIKNAFITLSSGKAMAFNIHCKSTDGKELRQQLWVASGEAKGCKNYYIDKKTGDKRYLPGFNQANAICLLTVGKELSKLETTPGVAEVYGEKTKVDVLKDLIGQDITLGVIKQLVDKTAKNPDTGNYEPTGESKTENEIDKVFRARDGLTVTEIRAKLTDPVFKGKWTEKWNGQVKDKTTNTSGAVAGAPAAKRTAGAAAPVDDLFV